MLVPYVTWGLFSVTTWRDTASFTRVCVLQPYPYCRNPTTCVVHFMNLWTDAQGSFCLWTVISNKATPLKPSTLKLLCPPQKKNLKMWSNGPESTIKNCCLKSLRFRCHLPIGSSSFVWIWALHSNGHFEIKSFCYTPLVELSSVAHGARNKPLSLPLFISLLVLENIGK